MELNGDYTEKKTIKRSCRVTSLSWQEPEEELNKLLPRKVSGRDRNVEVKYLVAFEV